MKRSTCLRLWFLLVCCALSNLLAPYGYAQKADNGKSDKKEIIKRARDGYYCLRRLGLVQFDSTVTPNWEVTLQDQMKSDPSGAQAGIKMLNTLHFAMFLGPDGNVKVTHRSENPPANEQIAKSFDQIYGGMEQALSGFFASWSIFMLTSPFPEIESEYKLQETGSGYELSYKEGDTDIVTSMSKDLAITEIKVSSRAFNSSLKPTLMKGAQGFTLSGYDGTYVPTSGAGNTRLNTQIEYQIVDGLQLPRKVKLEAVYDGQPNQMELVFSDYQVKHN